MKRDKKDFYTVFFCGVIGAIIGYSVLSTATATTIGLLIGVIVSYYFVSEEREKQIVREMFEEEDANDKRNGIPV
jgi:uncharacterized membrane protein YfcA